MARYTHTHGQIALDRHAICTSVTYCEALFLPPFEQPSYPASPQTEQYANIWGSRPCNLYLGQQFSYHTDATLYWQIDEPEVSSAPPLIQIGTTAIIAHFDPVESSTVEPFIMSYNLDGTTRWKFEHSLKIDEFTLGRDDLVYVTLDTAGDSDSKRIVVLQP